MQMVKNEKGQIVPKHQEDMTLFRHCSNNSISVTEEFFDEYVEPLLFRHGITMTECDWRDIDD